MNVALKVIYYAYKLKEKVEISPLINCFIVSNDQKPTLCKQLFSIFKAKLVTTKTKMFNHMLRKPEKQFENKNLFSLKKIPRFSIPVSFLQTVLWMSLNLPSSKLKEKLQRVETKQCISENYIQQDQVF